MQPAPDNVNVEDSESLFDFLDGDDSKPEVESGENVDQENKLSSRRTSPGSAQIDSGKPFPVIRKPVSVKQTGPLRPPRPGDPIEPPPPLTDGIRAADTPASPVTRKPASDLSGLDDLDLDLDLNLDADDWPSSDNWADRTHRPVPPNYRETGRSPLRKAGYAAGTLLVLGGVAYSLSGVPMVQQWTDQAMTTITGMAGQARQPVNDQAGNSQTVNNQTGNTQSVGSEPNSGGAIVELAPEQEATSAAQESAPKSLNELFRAELATLESLLEKGSLDEAEASIQTMDRSVYGYGAPEFTQITEQIAALRLAGGTSQQQSASAAQSEVLAEQQRLQEEARLQQEARLEAENARLAAEAQQRELAAQEQRAALESGRIASERAEQERIAAENASTQNRNPELDRSAAEAAQIRADRVAQEQARQEQLALARQERARLERQTAEQTAAAAAYASSDQQLVTPGASAQSEQDLAASQREAARQQRLIEARQREEQTAGSEPPAAGNALETESQSVIALAETSPIPAAPSVQQTAPSPITDADLQRVYGQFSQLQNAIENRDIGAVISLTERSGARIQQVMQLFENNVGISARLRNVSTLDAKGEIQGTLQITRLERADGTVTGPPQNFSAVRLSSVRQDNGWSIIRW